MVSSTISKSGGIAEVDAHVLSLIEAFAPFGQVPASMQAGKFDCFLFTARFSFVHDNKAATPPKPQHPCHAAA